MPYQLADEWFASKLDSVSSGNEKDMARDRKKGGNSEEAKTDKTAKSPKAGGSSSASGKTPPTLANVQKDARARAQAKKDERVVFEVSEGLSKGREPRHIRRDFSTDSLQMGEERFEAAVASLGMTVSKLLQD